MRVRVLFGVLGLGAMLALGCSGDSKGSTVKGKVTLNGTAVGGARVSFLLTGGDPKAPTGYGAVSEEDGSYTITGVKAGTYKVAVTKLVAKPGAKLPEGVDPEQIEQSGQGVNIMPQEYQAAADSPLNVTIKEGTNEGVNLELKGTAGPKKFQP
jgi:hypothetical protein